MRRPKAAEDGSPSRSHLPLPVYNFIEHPAPEAGDYIDISDSTTVHIQALQVPPLAENAQNHRRPHTSNRDRPRRM